MVNTYVLKGSPGHVVHLLACLTPGFPGGTSPDVLAPVGGTCTQPSPATLRTLSPSLSSSGLRTHSGTPNAARLTGITSEPGAPSTQSTPSARGAEPDARPCADRGDGRGVNAPLSMGTSEIPGKRAAVDSGRGLPSSVGESRSYHQSPKKTTAVAEGLPSLTDRLDNEGYREQQRVPVARQTQETADDQARKDEASRGSCPGRRTTKGGGLDPRRRQSASATLQEHQPRSRRKSCGQTSCGWTPSTPGVRCGAYPGEVCAFDDCRPLHCVP